MAIHYGRYGPTTSRRSAPTNGRLSTSVQPTSTFVEAKWPGIQIFTVTYRQDGPNGPLMYQGSKPYGREYRPNPLVVYAGRPWLAGERGEPSTVEGMIIRQMWMSPNPRPAFANR